MQQLTCINLLKTGLCLFLASILISCHSKKPDTFKDLKQSYLLYFKNDSLKTEAARYLLEYMPTHKFVDGEIIKAYDDSIRKYADTKDLQSNALQLLREKQVSLSQIFVNDTSGIDFDYLANHINLSVDNYRKYGWYKETSFHDFCQYILPYRIGEEYPTNWIKYFHHLYFQDNDSSILRKNQDERILLVMEWLKKRRKDFKGQTNLNLPDLSVETSARLKVGTCNELTKVNICALRSFGIPVAVDFTPAYAERTGGHQWTVLIRKEKFFAVNMDSARLEMDVDTTERHLTRVFRKYFHRIDGNHLAERGFLGFIPGHFNDVHLKDVTKSYYKTFNVDIEVKSPLSSNIKYGYLAVFTNKKWTPITGGKISNNRIKFKNVISNTVYLPLSIEPDFEIGINHPFTLTNSGEVKYLIEDTTHLTEVTLHRKYPLFKKIQIYIDRMTGGVFEGANDSSFSHPKVLYEITKSPGPNYNIIHIKDKHLYRYVRYKGAVASFCNVGEVEFYKIKSDTTKLTGKVIGSSLQSWEISQGRSKEAAFDGDPLTFSNSLGSDTAWTGLDLGSPKSIAKIKFIARTDMNIIEEGHKYELFYWGNNKWKSLGVTIANTPSLKYKNVPQNSLLWLRNLTGGTEERIFQIENGVQAWR